MCGRWRVLPVQRIAAVKPVNPSFDRLLAVAAIHRSAFQAAVSSPSRCLMSTQSTVVAGCWLPVFGRRENASIFATQNCHEMSCSARCRACPHTTSKHMLPFIDLKVHLPTATILRYIPIIRKCDLVYIVLVRTLCFADYFVVQVATRGQLSVAM